MKKHIPIILLHVLFQLYGGTLETVSVFSTAMNKNIPALVVLPDSYKNESIKFPIIILLHGYGGNYLDWSNHTNLVDGADQFNMIIFCPDGSPNSWYLDSPIDPNSQYETFFIDELIPWIRESYRMGEIGITGLSMGGHGSLYLAIRHPELFNAVSSMSGGVDLTYSTVKWEISNKIGSFKSYPERWMENSVVNMVHLLNETDFPIFVDCGYDDFFIENNRDLHQKLIEAKIKHRYAEKPGEHNWNYWISALDDHLKFFQINFTK
ncbi:MAG: alpha/beta hydrolase family protein [Candidatus Neomarinimicrobiota bacterium]|nr:alpha/beta hydrolase family protein [Candidatus Neomarinimicrobiota bacterium]